MLPEFGSVRDSEGNAINVKPQVLVNGQGFVAGSPSFIAIATAYAAYATPTDLFGIRNPVDSGKLIAVRQMMLGIHTTAAALQKIEFIRRSVLNTVGTPTAIDAIPYDSTNEVASAVVQSYGAAPTPHGVASRIGIHWGASAVPASAPGNFNPNGFSVSIVNNTGIDMIQPLILRPGEELNANYGGAALTAGFASILQVQWAECDLPT